MINSVARINNPDVTIAGQTSPGGIIVRGLVCDNGIFEPEAVCENVIVRHLRSRPQDPDVYPGEGDVNDDALRLDGAENIVIDHCSFANAVDESVQISQTSNLTIQNSILAETIGGHSQYGGMLINYSSEDHPQDNLSIHHNMWHRIGGRMPEISCEDNGEFATTNCEGHTINLELSNNLLWDPGYFIDYSGATDPGSGGGQFNVNLNWVNNYMASPEDFPYGFLSAGMVEEEGNSLFLSGNEMNLYPSYSDEELAYCCNDFPTNVPNITEPAAEIMAVRQDFPDITYTDTASVIDYMIDNVGAFPRDPMDRRYIASLEAGEFDDTALDEAGAEDAFDLDYDESDPPAAPTDTDLDGMPDDWETAHGLDPNVQDQNGTDVSLEMAGVDGYTNLECYLNELASDLISEE